MTAKPAEATELMQVLRALNRIEIQQGRMEEKLNALVGEKGRISNLEEDVKAHGEMLKSHEKKIQQARGGLAVFTFLVTAAEVMFHKVFK